MTQTYNESTEQQTWRPTCAPANWLGIVGKDDDSKATIRRTTHLQTTNMTKRPTHDACSHPQHTPRLATFSSDENKLTKWSSWVIDAHHSGC